MRLTCVASMLLLWGCSSGNGVVASTESGFALIQFLDSGKKEISRNRVLEFKFSSPVLPEQDLFERLKIQNSSVGGTEADFTTAKGVYVISGETVLFVPQLPSKPDRTDSGFREYGAYHVFLKGGPDALVSADGDKIPLGQEFLFDTDDNFDDPIPTEPPRATRLLARDVTTDITLDISRLDPRPGTQALMASADVLAAGNAIDPGAGGGPSYATPWQFELHVTEPLDPLMVTTDSVQMIEIRNQSINGTETLVDYKVPILVDVVQEIDPQGGYISCIRVRPVQTQVDNARYR